MASQSLCGKMGLRTAVLGSLAYLAVAAPIAAGSESMAAHDGADRIGEYYDRTPGAEKIAQVVMGAEVFSAGVAVVTASVPMRVSAPGTAAATLTLDDSDSSNFTVISMTRSGSGFWDIVGSNSQFYIRDSDQGRNVFVYTTGPSTSATWDVSAKLNTQASTTSQAGLNIGQGVAPSAPTDGDTWVTSAGMFVRAGGVTAGPFAAGGGTIGGSIAINQVAVGSGANTVAGSAALLWNTTSGFTSNRGIGGANEMFGQNAGNASGTGTSNTFVGANAGNNFGLASGNTCVGYYAGNSLTNGPSNVAVGVSALQASMSSDSNVAIGNSALISATGSFNTALGTSAGLNVTTGQGNIFLGDLAGDRTAPTASNRMVVGSNGAYITSVFIGNGEVHATPAGFGLSATSGLGSNVTGAGINIIGGSGTGTGPGGAVAIQTAAAGTAGSALNGAVPRWTVQPTGSTEWSGIATTAQPALSAASNGSIYYDSTAQGFFASVNGGAYAAFGSGTGNLSGSLTATRVPFASGATTLVDSAKFTFSATTGLNVNMASSGANNLNLGTSSGTALTSGARNTTVGQSAFAAATTTSDTVAIGYQAALVSNGSQSVYIGSGAGATFAGTFGSNVIIGFQAGGGTGASTSSVTLVGNQAGNLCQAANTTAIGNAALIALTTGLHNVAVGSSALGTQVTGTDCTALGENALALTTVSHNTVIGSNSGAIISTGHSNTIIGSNAGTITTTGVGNIFLGRGAGDGTALGASNRFVAGGGAQPIQDVYFGNGEVQGSPSSYTIHGSGGLGANVGGGAVTIAGGISTGNAAGGSVIFQTARSGVSSSSPNTLTTRLSVIEDGRTEWTGITTVNSPSASTANTGAIFYDSTLQAFYYSANGAGYLPLVSSGVTGSLTSGRVPFANGASSLTDSGTFLFSTTNGLSVKRSAAVRCEMFGDSAGNTTLTATDATLIGYHAGTALTTSVGLTAVGTNAAASLTTSARCTAIGFNALTTNATGGADCTAVGYEALKVTTINSNTAVGSQACTATTNGSDMTAIGDKALKAMVNAASCTAVGSSALVLSTSGNNTAIGAFAGSVNVSGSSNIFIGESAGDATANNVSNRFVAGSNSSPIATVFFGNGETNAAPQNVIFKATGGSGSNIAGASQTIAGGIGTGTGIGGSIVFQTAIAGGSSSTPNTLATALTIDQKLNIVCNNAAIATTATDGFLYLTSCAGAPTGVPTTFTGRNAIIYDTTNNKIWVYNGSWRGIVVV